VTLLPASAVECECDGSVVAAGAERAAGEGFEWESRSLMAIGVLTETALVALAAADVCVGVVVVAAVLVAELRDAWPVAEGVAEAAVTRMDQLAAAGYRTP